MCCKAKINALPMHEVLYKGTAIFEIPVPLFVAKPGCALKRE